VPGHRNAWNVPKKAMCSGKLPAIDSKLAVYTLHYA